MTLPSNRLAPDAAASAAAINALERARTLPPAAPALVLLTSDEARILTRLDRLCVDAADTFDLRTGVLWIEVSDGQAFLRSLVAEVEAPADRSSVRVAWAMPDATVDQLLREALHGTTLHHVANALRADNAIIDPPAYEIRYQPLVRLDDRTVIGFESLIRATQGGHSLDAEELIQRADVGGWFSEFDQLARTLAVQGVGSWLGEGLLFLNVMAPGGAFDVEAIKTTIRQAEQVGIEPDQLVLEAVERNRYTDVSRAAEQISELRELGVRIAVDDVGDGFASLTLVTHFKPDVVKISGTIVSMLPSEEALAVVGSIVHLAHQTGAWVVAENIESQAQADALAAAGVDWGQGNFLGTPAPAGDANPTV